MSAEAGIDARRGWEPYWGGVLRAGWPGVLKELVSTKELTLEQVEPFGHLNIDGMVA